MQFGQADEDFQVALRWPNSWPSIAAYDTRWPFRRSPSNRSCRGPMHTRLQLETGQIRNLE